MKNSNQDNQQSAEELNTYAALLDRLENAFGVHLQDSQAKIYMEKIYDFFPVDDFEAAVETIIETKIRFPSIAELLKYKPYGEWNKDGTFTHKHKAMI